MVSNAAGGRGEGQDRTGGTNAGPENSKPRKKTQLCPADRESLGGCLKKSKEVIPIGTKMGTGDGDESPGKKRE